MPSARDFLLRGLIAGLIAGFATFAVAYLVGEPPLDAAIAVEEQGTGLDHHHAAEPPAVDAAPDQAGGQEHSDHEHSDHEHEAGETEVPRTLQSTLGLLSATLLAGATVGGLVGVLTALALGRFGSLGVRALSLAVAGTGFVVAYAVPFAVYPPNPPGVGDGDTIGTRTALYFLLLAISLIAAATAVLVGHRMARRWGGWAAGLLAVAGYLAVVGAAGALMPYYEEVPATFPASVLYDFRAASFLTALTLWAVLGVALAALLHRQQATRTRGRAPVLTASR